MEWTKLARTNLEIKHAASKPRKIVRPRATPASPRRLKDLASPASTLGDLLGILGPGLFSIMAAPLGLDVRVNEPAIYDPIDEPPIHSGDVLLAVGIRADSREAIELIKKAGSCKSAAVVFKLRDGLDSLVEPARSAGVALISTPAEMTWDQLAALLKTATASAGGPGEAAGHTPMGDLFTLANAVAAMVGGPVTIEDPQSNVLAFSSLDDPIDQYRREAILGRRVAEKWIVRLRDAGIFTKLNSTEGPVEVDLPVKGYRRRLAIAVRAGTEILGSIWVAESKSPLGAEAEDALKEASRIAALHLVRHRVAEDLDRRMRGELLRSVLEGRGSAEVLASKLGLEARSQFTVAAFDIQTQDETELVMKRERALDLVSVYCETFRRPAICLSIDRTIYALLPTSQRPEILRLAQGIVKQVDAALRAKVLVGVGSTVSHLKEVTRSRLEADQMLRVLNEDDGGRAIADVEELGAYTILLELKDLASDKPHMHSGKLARLIESDTKQGTSHIPTLRAYLEAFGDVRKAAITMNVHPNTIKYRMGRLTEISGIDLNDATERLVIELALRLL